MRNIYFQLFQVYKQRPGLALWDLFYALSHPMLAVCIVILNPNNPLRWVSFCFMLSGFVLLQLRGTAILVFSRKNFEAILQKQHRLWQNKWHIVIGLNILCSLLYNWLGNSVFGGVFLGIALMASLPITLLMLCIWWLAAFNVLYVRSLLDLLIPGLGIEKVYVFFQLAYLPGIGLLNFRNFIMAGVEFLAVPSALAIFFVTTLFTWRKQNAIATCR